MVSDSANGSEYSIARLIAIGENAFSHGPNASSVIAPTLVQSASSPALALSRSPVTSPHFIAAPFSAPADVPEMAAISIRSSSSNRSSAPHVNAPCAPPP